jgi:hypothetical protein
VTLTTHGHDALAAARQPADAAAAATLAAATPETLDELARLLTATAAAVARATPLAPRNPEPRPW